MGKNGKPVNEISMPIARIKKYQLPGGKKGKSFTTTIGAATDLLSEGTRRLLVNSIFWGLNIPVPEKANIDVVGEYNPSAFGLRKKYWLSKRLRISDLR